MTIQPPALAGVRAAITRPRGTADVWTATLEGAGAVVSHYPAIAIVPPHEWNGVDDALSRLDTFHWVAFTSANGARGFADRWRHASRGPFPAAPRLAAIAEGTASVVAHHLRPVDFVAATHTAQGLGAELPVQREARVLFPAGELAGDDLERGLVERGASVTRAIVYRTIAGAGVARLAEALAAGEIDMVVFSSPSAMHFLAEELKRRGASPGDVFSRGRAAAIAIGPITGAALRERGARDVAIASTETAEGILEAVRRTREERGT